MEGQGWEGVAMVRWVLMLVVGLFSMQILQAGSVGGLGKQEHSIQLFVHQLEPSVDDQAALKELGLFFYRVPIMGESVGVCELCLLSIDPAHFVTQIITEGTLQKVHSFHTRCIKQWAEDNHISFIIDPTQHLCIEHRDGKLVVRAEADKEQPKVRRSDKRDPVVLPTWIMVARLVILAAAGYLFSFGTVVASTGG